MFIDDENWNLFQAFCCSLKKETPVPSGEYLLVKHRNKQNTSICKRWQNRTTTHGTAIVVANSVKYYFTYKQKSEQQNWFQKLLHFSHSLSQTACSFFLSVFVSVSVACLYSLSPLSVCLPYLLSVCLSPFWSK